MFLGSGQFIAKTITKTPEVADAQPSIGTALLCGYISYACLFCLPYISKPESPLRFAAVGHADFGRIVLRKVTEHFLPIADIEAPACVV